MRDAREAREASEARPPLEPQVYQCLRALAGKALRRERQGHTLQPTALVHEAWLKLAAEQHCTWTDRTQFLGLAAHVVRQVLVDHARRRKAAKRGGDWQRLTLHDSSALTLEPTLDLLALDEALEALEAGHPRVARVVELRFFGGLPGSEVALALGSNAHAVEQDWRFARAWLARRLADEG